MLKKGVTIVKFTRPESIMGIVLAAIRDGSHTWFTIKRATGIDRKKVESALKNLTYTGVIVRKSRKNKCSAYKLAKETTC